MGAWQLNTMVVMQEHLRKTGTQAAHHHNVQDYVGTVHFMAPHLFSTDLDGDDGGLSWVFSSGFSNREDENTDHFTLSTYMFNHEPDFINNDTNQLRGFLQTALYSSFTVACGLAPCENVPCLMNNVDGVDECRMVPLVLCPGCLRKLEVTGAMPDVMAALRQLQSVYQELEQGATTFANELEILQKWTS